MVEHWLQIALMRLSRSLSTFWRLEGKLATARAFSQPPQQVG